MKDKTNQEDDFSLFKESFSDIKRLKQDRVLHNRQPKQRKSHHVEQKQANASFHFSDEYEPVLNQQGPLSYVKSGADRYLAKQLRRGDIQPEVILDLHGMTRQQAKLELASLIEHCLKRHLPCACIVHGIGARVLKHKLPHWLVQHPAIEAFHQAPLEWGGDGAIIVAFKTEKDPKLGV